MKSAGNFSHIYIEEAASHYPWTAKVLARFPKAERIWVDDYRAVFGRPRQNFRLQKESMKLILAVKKTNLLYRGSDHAQDFGYPNFYYNALILNCLYNCEYCYLQGMYASANIVVHVNLEDFFQATRKAIRKRDDPASPLYLAISYDTDLLALEALLPYCREWIEFSRGEKGLLIELRTKSANFNSLSGLTPHPGIVLAWTLSPDEVVRSFEKRTPSLHRRLRAAQKAIRKGWQVRICFDPVLRIEGWREAYRRCVEETFQELPPGGIRDVGVGGFRMKIEHFKRIKKFRDDSVLFHYPFPRRDDTLAYGAPETREIIEFMREQLQNYLPAEKIVAWT